MLNSYTQILLQIHGYSGTLSIWKDVDSYANLEYALDDMKKRKDSFPNERFRIIKRTVKEEKI